MGVGTCEAEPLAKAPVPTEVVEGEAVSCSWVGDPRVLGTRTGTRLPEVGVVTTLGVFNNPPETDKMLGMEVVDRVLKEDVEEVCRVWKEEEEEAW